MGGKGKKVKETIFHGARHMQPNIICLSTQRNTIAREVGNHKWKSKAGN